MKKEVISVVVALFSLGIAYAPIPGLQQRLIVVSGSELEEPLKVLETSFEQQYPDIKIDIKIQGSQEIVNKFIDNKNDFKPTVLIPANSEILSELEQRWQSQNSGSPFYEAPQPIAKTMLVAIAWPERGKALFPSGEFRWDRVELAMESRSWSKLGGQPDWGSFDFRTTDPSRSNSGQLTLSLFAAQELGSLDSGRLNSPEGQALFTLVKRSVYQPPRSTDILLQEFISQGPNDADVATVYESIALYRWQQAAASQGKPYQIYYLNPTIDTVSTAAIVRKDVSPSQAKAARQFVNFLKEPAQQAVFIQHGFRPVEGTIDIKAVANSPWNQNIPGAEVSPTTQVMAIPDRQVLTEIIRQWERAN